MRSKRVTAVKFLVFVLLSLSVNSAFSQSTDEQLAEYYYNNGQYEQALLYYEKLYKTNRSGKIYDNYLQTLIALGNFEEAEKLIKKKLKSSQNEADVYLELGELYKRFEMPELARGAFDDALNLMQPGRNNGIRMGNAFIKLSEYEYALATYEKSRKISNDGYGFHFELANLLGLMGNYEDMVTAFLDLLMESPNYIQTVQNSIDRNLNIQEDEKNAEMVRTQLLRQSQKYPNELIYTEMLIWLFGQRKDFPSALVQAIAMDKRMNENGFRLMDLGRLAASNLDFTTARKAYQAVVDKGMEGDYYVTARTELLQVMKSEVFSKPGYSRDQLLTLKSAYTSALAELGRNAQTAVMVKEIAHLEAFYLDETAEAVTELNAALDIPGLYPSVLALIKLELGDILLFQGEIWEASLLFSQVELDFKEDVLGHEAKFRNAKISYYTGDFEWAQAQLDVLKASTSKLISNDAIDLSLLITDNFAMDTIVEPMLMFAQADLLAYQNKFQESFTKLDSLVASYPGHSLEDEILMLKATIYERRGMFEEAASSLQIIVDSYSYDILGDDAIFKLAQLKESVFNLPEEAMKLYERILNEYPGSLYVVEARKRFRTLRGDEI